MPRGDGTGPLGLGALTGRGMGVCRGAGVPAAGWGRGLGRGLGLAMGIYGLGRCLGRGLGRQAALDASEGEQERLTQIKAELEQQMNLVNARLEQVKPKV